MKSLLLKIGGVLYIIVNGYFWYKYYKQKDAFKRHLHDREEYLKKHNCVVMYGKMRITGWPGYPGRYSPGLSNTHILFEPVIYFIKTTRRELKIAVMYLSALPIIDALHEILKDGVKIQIIVSFESPLNLQLEKLVELGAEIRYYLGTGVDSIMHYKYAIKDSSNESGYAMYGSINWTASGFLENYENIIITASQVIVQGFKRNFNNAWAHLTSSNENPQFRKKIIEARHSSQLIN